MRVTFLGTAGSIPTKRRNPPAIAIRRKSGLILFDCGEGTQRQMFMADIGLSRGMKIFITHIHSDHIMGLPGLFQTMSLLNREHPLHVFGPEGIRDFMESVKRTARFELTYPLEIREVGEGVACREEEYRIYAVWADHIVPSLAYALIENERPGRFHPERALDLGVPEGPLWSRLQHGERVTLADGRVVLPELVVGPPRPGRKIVYSGDTRPCKAVLELARGADLLIHESTYDDELADKAQNGHSTPSQAAWVAREAGVKRLILTHISARYTDTAVLLEQARRVFPRVVVAEDLMEVEIPYAE
ncbi:MAG: ribonuclease Z [Candidatus Bathyarchaeia archaeon]